ncbi:hypothetical protein [Photobacterium rosenbergii]|uniref:Uncharacterized protein n=1 Tax=Photobacterium rosenbergii TaxID=294936 RepID=A0ABU3ZFE2_9GAMM|nr:hypothetical protein [Photobacterium rosenbergii]MDV5168828.1 hypothetical protein [Photobacterium rosenbergii]
MFKAIKDNFKKAEAAVIVENLLQTHVDTGVFQTSLSIKDIANKMVQQAWEVKPDLLGGRFGTRPHKLSIASFTVAVAIVSSGNSNSESSSDFQNVCLMMFGNIMDEIEVNGRLYNMSETDRVVIELAMNAVTPIMEAAHSSPDNHELDAILKHLDESTYTWDEWYRAFVSNACSVEGSGLVQDENGLSLIDMMDHEPLKRAHRDGICPVRHGIAFAQQFDINKFGMR